MNSFFRKIARAAGNKIAAWGSPYESANSSYRRGSVPGSRPTDHKLELTTAARSEIVRRNRYLDKNSGFTREMIADMAIYSTGNGIRPQAQSRDAEWNRLAEEYFARWASRPEVTNRFSFAEVQHIVCRTIDRDGEVFAIKVRDRNNRARIQLIETHRCCDKQGDDTTHDGISYTPEGAPVFYRVLMDNGEFRDIFATAVMHIYDPEIVTCGRGLPTLQHSINHILDEMELLALEKHAAKDNSQISRVLKSASDLAGSGDYEVVSETEPESSDPTTIQKIIGGRIAKLLPGESMEAFQSQRPSPVFTGFLEHIKKDSAAGMLPYEFVLDSSKIGGAGVRLVVAKAARRFEFRQMIIAQRFLKPTWGWVIGDAIDRGELDAVAGWNQVRWTTPRRITVDAGREAQQNRADVDAGLKTLEDHFAELGQDFDEQLEVRAQNARACIDAAAKHGVPVEMLWRPGGSSTWGVDAESDI